MNQFVKYPQRQDCGLKLSKGNSGETSINLSTEIAYFLSNNVDFKGGEEISLSLTLYKEDFIKATCHMIELLPLYKTSSTNYTQIKYDNNLFREYIDSINAFFGNRETSIYNVILSAVSFPRFYLKNLKDTTSGFNIRKFLFEKHSQMIFKKEDDKFVLRINSKDYAEEKDIFAQDYYNNLVLKESVLKLFVLKTLKFIVQNDGIERIEPYASNELNIKLSSEKDGFSLIGMFIDTTIEDLKARNDKQERWFTSPTFKLNGKEVFLSTQWYGVGNYQLTFDGFQKLIKVCYGDKYFITKNNADEFELWNNSESPQYIITNALPLQQIFYGAPGTGKSNTIKREVDEKGKKNFRTTFHPDSDYSTFVGCYKPMMKESTITKDGVTSKEEKIIYSFCPQAFTNAYVEAWSTEEDVYLIIEEINRGNCAQIFGDLFQLLDRDGSGQSEYPIMADKDLGDYIADKLSASTRTDIPQGVKDGKQLLLPNNLYIWATMNTSDQSLFPIDSAFKRRWDWQYMPICKGRDKQGNELTWKIKVGGQLFDWWKFLESINEQIGTTTSSEDKKLGYFFCKAVDGVISAETFVAKVVFYLWNDVFKDFDFDNSIFNDDENGKLSFNKFYTLNGDGKVVVNEEKVLKFMENLGVMGEDINDLGEDDEENDDENSGLNVTFPDGTIVTGRTRFDSYISTIKKIGIENIKSIIPNLKYKRLGVPLISLEKYDAIANNDQRYSYVEVEGCYFIKGMNGRTMRKVLLAISDLLKLNLVVEYK